MTPAVKQPPSLSPISSATGPALKKRRMKVQMKREQQNSTIATMLNFCEVTGINLCHTFLHQDAGTILDDEGPAHNLCAHIEELGEYAFTIVRHAEDAAKGRQRLILLSFKVLRHLVNRMTKKMVRKSEFDS